MKQQGQDISRAHIVFVSATLIAIAIVVKLGMIQWAEGVEWQERADEFVTEFRDIEAARGDILAADGSLLATSLPIYQIRMDLAADGLDDETFKNGVEPLARSLAELFNGPRGKSVQQYRDILLEGRRLGKRYVLVQDDVKYHEVQAAKDFPIFEQGRYQGGVIFEKRNERIYPFESLARRTLGRDESHDSPVGLEVAFSKQLAGLDGKRLERRLVGGQWMPVNDGNDIEPHDGQDVRTSIDIHLQDVAESALLRQLQEHEADHGCAVLMEVETGFIKAIANLGWNEKRQTYLEQYNYAVGESTEPGSTFKLPAVLAGLEEGLIEVTDTVDTKKGLRVIEGRKMRDSNGEGYGIIPLDRAFELSSNVGISAAIYDAFKKDPQRFVDRLHAMGLGQPLGLDISGEGKPKIKSVQDKDWWGTTLPWMSIGYETTMTPLQILAFYNAVANDGVMVKPQFVTHIQEEGQVVWEAQPVILNPAIASRQNIEKCKRMLEGVVEQGTASNLKDADYSIAGKTGTAQILNTETGTYGAKGERRYLASFVGYFPADDPHYACIVQVTAPKKYVYYGNLIAGPVFKEIADKVFARRFDLQTDPAEVVYASLTNSPVSKDGNAYALSTVFDELGVDLKHPEVESTWIRTHTKTDRVDATAQSIYDGQVPNVKGMGLSDALYLLEDQGLRVKVAGRGIVKEQSIPPGADIHNGMEISLTLSL